MSATSIDRDWEEPFDDYSQPPLDVNEIAEYCGSCLDPKFECSREFFIVTATMTTYESNKLEGVGCSVSDTTRLINNYARNPDINAELSIDGENEKHKKARREVLQHFRVLLEVHKFALSGQPLTEDIIKQWHQLLMESLVEPCGVYRTEGVFAGQKIFPNHDYVPGFMASFVSQLNSRLKDIPTASSSSTTSPSPNEKTRSLWAVSAWASHSFVSIHPFVDGNGRMCRLLGNYVLWRSGFPFAVPISCPRKKYIQALRYADRDWKESRTGKLAFIILSNAKAVVENFNSNQTMKARFPLPVD